ARGDRLPALGDGAGEEGDAEGLEHAARDAGVLALAVRDVPDPLGRAELDPLVHRELDRPLVPRVHLLRRRGLARAAPLAAAHAAREDEARVARFSRGDLPLQQPAARRPLPDDPLGGDVPDPLRRRTRRGVDRGRALLHLLLPELRAAAPPADGDRAADRLAARVALVAETDLFRADRLCARG